MLAQGGPDSMDGKLDKLDVLVEGAGKMLEVLENEAKSRENFRSVTPWFLAEPIASNTE